MGRDPLRTPGSVRSADPMAKAKSSATDMLSGGIVLAIFAAVVGGVSALTVSPTAGFIVGGLVGIPAQIMLMIGIIAKGVEVGNRSR